MKLHRKIKDNRKMCRAHVLGSYAQSQGLNQVWGGRVVRWSWISFQVRGVLLVWIRVGQGPAALAVGAGGGCLDVFTLVCPFSFLSPSLWETTRYRLKYCLKGSLSPNTTTTTQSGQRSKSCLGNNS